MSTSETTPLLDPPVSEPAPATEVDTQAPENGLDSLGHRPYRFKEHLARTLESDRMHWAVIAFTALDGLFVVTSISWDFLQDPACICTHSCQETPRVLEVFELVSLAITALFLLEIPLSLYALGLKHYTTAEHAYLHSFDAAVIITTFALEVFLRGRDAEVANLLIFARLWRLAKLVSTVTVGTTEVNDIEGRAPGHTFGTPPHAREETLLEAVQESWRKEKAALLAELENTKARLRVLEDRLAGGGTDAKMTRPST